MDIEGRRIDEEDLELIVIEDNKLPFLRNVSGGKFLSFDMLLYPYHSITFLIAILVNCSLTSHS